MWDRKEVKGHRSAISKGTSTCCLLIMTMCMCVTHKIMKKKSVKKVPEILTGYKVQLGKTSAMEVSVHLPQNNSGRLVG